MFFILAVVIAAAVLYAYTEYNRKPASLHHKKAQAKVSASELAREYEADENAANAKYLGNVVDVSGQLLTVERSGDTSLTIMMGQPDALHNISCLADAAAIQTFERLKPGDSITVRGICSGYLMDVEFTQAILITPKN